MMYYSKELDCKITQKLEDIYETQIFGQIDFVFVFLFQISIQNRVTVEALHF